MPKYLNNQDKQEMTRRHKQIEDQLMIAEALQQSFSNWFAKKTEEYKLDPNKRWVLDPKSGQINEQKQDDRTGNNTNN